MSEKLICLSAQNIEESKKVMIIKFREEFGCGIMVAKKFLLQTDYDYDKAVTLYRSQDWTCGMLVDYER